MSWILLAALWLQAVAAPVQIARADAVDGSVDGITFGICSTHSIDQKQKPAVPSGQHHHQQDCCLSGGCAVSAVLFPPVPNGWVIQPTEAGRAHFSLTSVVPRAPPNGTRPYTTGPPTLS